MRDFLRDYATNGFAVLPGRIDGALLRTLQERTSLYTDARNVPAAAAHLVDFEAPDDAAAVQAPAAVQRVRKPYEADPFFWELACSEALLEPVRALLGDDVRLHHGKINVKAPGIGAPLEWHQDWAFIPHSNSALAIVSIMIDDSGPQSGPVQYLPGSHLQQLHAHHHDGVFMGAIDPAGLDLASACSVTGTAGTVAIHHPWVVHGSGFNTGTQPRRILFYEYAAADAWPLFYGVDWEEFNRRMVCGEPTDSPRLEEVEVRMPYPTASGGQGRIYDQQRRFERRYFERDARAQA